jgi:hypothetical protein
MAMTATTTKEAAIGRCLQLADVKVDMKKFGASTLSQEVL